ncbi:MAG: ribonuclease H-like domain-containing protein [Deltaproteobacteria bacterium]|nr:ribonuclease H-like domain-containing protein [Deltaproteobacteria bacterium]
MLNETYLHLPGIGPQKEQRLWRHGHTSWSGIGDGSGVPWLGPRRAEIVARCVEEEQAGRWDTVAGLLPPAEHWRALVRRRGRSPLPLRWLALDIETTGLRPPYNHTTVIGLCGHATNHQPVALVAGEPDWAEPLADYLAMSEVLLTFNGRLFDVPFLEQDLRRHVLRFPPFHVDLFHALRRLGITGGLKRIQQQLGFRRDEDLEDLNGYAAVLLWQAAQRGRAGARETLVRYCLEDVVVLPRLAAFAYDRLAEQAGRPWRCPAPPQVSLGEYPFDAELAHRMGQRTRGR